MEKSTYDNLKKSFWAFCRYSNTELNDATFDAFLAGYLISTDMKSPDEKCKYSHNDLVI